MKRLILTLTLFAMSFSALTAQKYEPMDTWPYVYENFLDGAVRTRSGSLITEGKFNVSVADGALHFIKNGQILKADMTSIYTAKAGEAVFVNMGKQMYQVLSEKENGWVLQLTTVDLDKMGRVDIGYGIQSSSASAMNVNSLLDVTVDMKFESALERKETGNVIPLSVTRYIYAGGRLVPATRSSFRDFPGIDKAAADAFIKEHKIKWNKVESLELLIDFVYSQFPD